MTELEKKLAKALARVMKWAGPIAGDNRNLFEAKEEEESASEAYSALAVFDHEQAQETNRQTY